MSPMSPMSPRSPSNTIMTTVAMAGGLFVLAIGNEKLLRFTEVTHGVNWIYLPAGLRMCYVLVLPVQGTLAVFLASALMAWRDSSLTWPMVVVGACITAAAPLLARVVALQRLGLQPNLENLDSRMLLNLTLVFGLFSTTLHQAWYVFLGRESAFMMMWLGDALGALLCLYGLKGLAAVWRDGNSA